MSDEERSKRLDEIHIQYYQILHEYLAHYSEVAKNRPDYSGKGDYVGHILRDEMRRVSKEMGALLEEKKALLAEQEREKGASV